MPSTVHAFTTTRLIPNITDLNADAINDFLSGFAQLPSSPCWLTQKHTNTAVKTDQAKPDLVADAHYTDKANVVLAIKTADCLPILICNSEGNEIAAIHAGWRSLGSGIIEQTLQYFKSNPNELHCWFGPAICQHHFEVGSDVLELFLNHNPDFAAAFKASKQQPDKYFLNLVRAAEIILEQYGIKSLSNSQHCTHGNAEWFFSYRRQHDIGQAW